MIKESHQKILLRFFVLILLSVMAVGLGYVVLSLPSEAPGLSEEIAQNIELSGVSHPVTAVLLNFRGYDTLLEMAVLLLALLAVWSLGDRVEQTDTEPGPVLDFMARLLVPLLIVVAGYLLWVGAYAPGGAFQAGSVAAAAGVLLLLSGWRFYAKFPGSLLRFSVALGLIVFIVVAIMMVALGGWFLQFPTQVAGALILLIEAAATVSIGFTLALLFLGDKPSTNQTEINQSELKEKK